MKKTGIFYGSTNGDTESVAIKSLFNWGSGKKMYTMSADTTPMPYNPTKYCY